MGIDHYAYKVRRLHNGESVNEDDILTLIDDTRAYIADDITPSIERWYGHNIDLLQNYMKKTTNINDCEWVYITSDMLTELERALDTVDKAVVDNPRIHTLLSKYVTVPEKGITHINSLHVLFSYNDVEEFGEFLYRNIPDAFTPTGRFFYAPFADESQYYLQQLAEIRDFINSVRPWLTDDTFAVYNGQYTLY